MTDRPYAWKFIGLSLGAVVCCLVALTASADVPAGVRLPAFNLADIPEADLSSGGWGPAEQEGNRRFRTARKGGTRMFNVKAWWDADLLRPPESVIYLLEVDYKDTASTPAAFYAYGWLERYGGASVVHHFGGTGDGKWKTARVPVSWGYLIRLPEQRQKTAFGVSADADLPISDIRLGLAARADQEAYNAETRAYVRTVQQAKGARGATRPAERAFLVGKDLPALVAFSWPALVPLLPTAQPKDEQVGAPVRIRLCLNELEGGSFGVYANGADLTEVEYGVSMLKGPAGTLQVDVIRRAAEYCLVQGGKGLTVFPQRLWPVYKADVPAGHSHWFVFNLRTRAGRAKTGLYTGKVFVTGKAGGKELVAELPLEVEVLPVTLLTMDQAGLFMGGCTSGLVPCHDIEFQVEYNQNGTNLWFSGVRPVMTLKGGKMELDFAYLDEWMSAAKRSGLVGTVYFLGGDPYGWPDTVTILRDLARIDPEGKNDEQLRLAWNKKQAAEENRDKVLPEVRPLFAEWVRRVDEHARTAGWPELIMTPFDEPAKWTQGPFLKKSEYAGAIGTGPWIKPFFKDCCAIMRQAAPKMRIYASIHHNRQGEGILFLDDVDVFCTNAIHEDPQLGEKVRAGKKAFWQYTGTGPVGLPDQARFSFGFYFAAFDSRGSLCWAYNWGRGWDTTEGSNWMYAWQTPFDTIPAPFFEGLREAWDDRRVIETYRKTFADDAEALGVLKQVLDQARTSRAPGGRDTVSDFWAAIDDVSKMDAWRKVLLDRLAKAAAR